MERKDVQKNLGSSFKNEVTSYTSNFIAQHLAKCSICDLEYRKIDAHLSIYKRTFVNYPDPDFKALMDKINEPGIKKHINFLNKKILKVAVAVLILIALGLVIYNLFTTGMLNVEFT